MKYHEVHGGVEIVWILKVTTKRWASGSTRKGHVPGFHAYFEWSGGADMANGRTEEVGENGGV